MTRFLAWISSVNILPHSRSGKAASCCWRREGPEPQSSSVSTHRPLVSAMHVTGCFPDGSRRMKTWGFALRQSLQTVSQALKPVSLRSGGRNRREHVQVEGVNRHAHPPAS